MTYVLLMDMTLYIKYLLTEKEIKGVKIKEQRVRRRRRRGHPPSPRWTAFNLEVLNSNPNEVFYSSFPLFRVKEEVLNKKPVGSHIQKIRWWSHWVNPHDFSKIHITPLYMARNLNKEIYYLKPVIENMLKEHPLPRKQLLKTLRVIPQDMFFNLSTSLNFLKR